MNKMMSASENDTEMFHKLINNQRRNKHQNTEILVLNDKNLTDENDILNGWFEYFKGLSTPDFNDDHFDLERLTLAQEQNQIIEELENRKSEPVTPVSIPEIEKSIKKMKTGKAMDSNGTGIASEHFKLATEEIIPTIVRIVNKIFMDKDITENMKTGILTPVLKKNKDGSLPGNYRGKTVTNKFSNIVESILEDRLEKKVNSNTEQITKRFH